MAQKPHAGYVNSDNLTIIKTGALRLALLLRLAMELAPGATAARAVGEIRGTRLTRNERECP